MSLSAVSRASKWIEEPHQPVKMGYGEYIVLSEDGKPLSLSLFAKVYEVLCRYSPGAILQTKMKDIQETYSNRYELICKEIKQLDSHLEIAFVPRILYELVLLRKCIREDLAQGSI